MQEMSTPVENFSKSLFEPKLTAFPGSKISDAPESKSFAMSFIHLELRRGEKEDYMKLRENKPQVS